jgi:hypothetical protein
MKIKGWEKISGYTYKGYAIVNPMHNATEDIYYATILNLNEDHKPKWDMVLKIINSSDIITFRIEDNLTKHLMATSGLTKANINSLQKFIVEYEILIDEILDGIIASKLSKRINGGGSSAGLINMVQQSGTAVHLYDPATLTQINLLDTIKDLRNKIEQMEKELAEMNK